MGIPMLEIRHMWDCLIFSLFWWHDILILRCPLVSVGPGPRFSIKMTSYQYRKSHCGDKTVVFILIQGPGALFINNMIQIQWKIHFLVTHFLAIKSVHSISLAMTAELWCHEQNPVVINSSPPGQNGQYFCRQYFQMHFRDWKALYFD